MVFQKMFGKFIYYSNFAYGNLKWSKWNVFQLFQLNLLKKLLTFDSSNS